MSQDKGLSNNQKLRKIFVACLPGTTNPQEVTEYFKKFSYFVKVKLKYKNRAKKICAGYCIVTVTSDAVDKILSYPKHFFKGRYLDCKRFSKGKQLSKEKSKLEKKKVFIRNIPRNMSDQDLKNIFSKEFGEVERAYIIRSSKKIGKKQNLYGFVFFKDKKSAQNAIKMNILKYEITSRDYASFEISFFKKQYSNLSKSTDENPSNFKKRKNKKNDKKKEIALNNNIERIDPNRYLDYQEPLEHKTVEDPVFNPINYDYLVKNENCEILLDYLRINDEACHKNAINSTIHNQFLSNNQISNFSPTMINDSSLNCPPDPYFYLEKQFTNDISPIKNYFNINSSKKILNELKDFNNTSFENKRTNSIKDFAESFNYKVNLEPKFLREKRLEYFSNIYRNLIHY